jgi:hypothetical protein
MKPREFLPPQLACSVPMRRLKIEVLRHLKTRIADVDHVSRSGRLLLHEEPHLP